MKATKSPIIDYFFLYQSALFVAEIIQGLGHAMDLKWVIEGRAYTGTFCTAQGKTTGCLVHKP